ncbi:MAG: PAS domain-containing sensor histidine kinase [Parasphingorhabdus sp.]|uniref:PAS domain-containing sensor histidine kinase n=1 Tax=Parasphingorhabdus sp. TaxID=2709688 RepID=UPI00300212D1
MSEHNNIEDLADLYDNAPCGYLSLSSDGHIVKVNRTLADWLQHPPTALVDRPIHDILSFGGKIAYETHLAPILLMHGSVGEIALDLLDTEQTKIPVIANAAECRAKTGELLFTRLTLFKAADRLTFERSLIEAKVKAEQRALVERKAIEIRDQFVAVLGHDLRNPLAAVAAGTRMLTNSGHLDARDQMIVHEMDASLKRANKLIDDVLDLARGKLGGGFALNYKKNQDLRPVIEQVVTEILVVADDREIIIQLDVGDPVDCDPDRIAQLVSNLLANAVRHGAPDQSIVLAAHKTPKELIISVTNGGEPIPANAIGKLFEPFARGKALNSNQGLGLGLFIVDEIAKAHGGRMIVTSKKAETKFTFQMPLKKRAG